MFDLDTIVSLLTGPEMVAFGQVIFIDLVLAGDNAIVVGLAAAGLPAHQRTKVILIGIGAATLMRIGFALATSQLLLVFGLTLAGGVLLLWVCWKFWREIEHQRRERKLEAQRRGERLSSDERKELAAGESALPGAAPAKTMRQAIVQIVIADVSMSLDNVLAVAGAAHDHPNILIFGLALSVALMGLAASLIASLLKRYPWIAYFGLAVIFYVAIDMIWRGSMQVMNGV
ncbi:YjbE family integral membrane protein [Dongia mobilis]|uniref:YjbE family integral membrane protein n=1 Tax=Dongia mobilis TaxID=578943 RepID=A0A4R6WVS8_9PROT|nr:TerC family protein [Dongia mobilis]TDQ84559.1 YjbE family integral membrane protein [Dongia mobilis]